MKAPPLSEQVRETRRIQDRTGAVRDEWVRVSGRRRIRGPGTASLAGVRWIFRIATAGGPALLPLCVWMKVAGNGEGMGILLVGLLLLLSCAWGFSSMDGGPLRPFEALRMPSRRALLLAGWRRRSPWVLATSISWAVTVALGVPGPWSASRALFAFAALLTPPLIVVLWSWSKNPERETRDFERGGVVCRILLGAATCAVTVALHAWASRPTSGIPWKGIVVFLFGLIMIAGHGWDLIVDLRRGPVVPFRGTRCVAGFLESPVRYLCGVLPVVLVGACAMFPLNAGVAKALAEIPWEYLVPFLAFQATAILLAARMALGDFERQECTPRRDRTGEEVVADKPSDFHPRPRLLAEPAPRGLAEALRFRSGVVEPFRRVTTLTIGLLVLGMGFLTLGSAWSALVAALLPWRVGTVEVSARIHLLGVAYRAQHLQNLRRTLIDVAFPVALACLFWGTLFGWYRPGGLVPLAVAAGALLFRAGMAGVWRLLDRQVWKMPIAVTLGLLLLATVFARGLFGPDPIRAHLVLAGIYGGIGVAGLAWHLATLDEERLREENRA